MRPDPTVPFRWQDGERTIIYGRGVLGSVRDELGDGYVLLSTSRALASVPSLGERAGAVHELRAGRVDEIAGELRDQVHGDVLVALGGGRVIDTAKALAAADPPRRVIAIPTTLSGAEMTSVHRHAPGVSPEAPRVRPTVVINDPMISAAQPLAQLADSAANGLGHAVEGPLTSLGNPVSRMSAQEAAVLLRDGLANREDPDRDALALGALLAGYVIGATHYGLHHVLSQTLVRFAGLPHGRANAIMLPHTTAALALRDPQAIRQLDERLGESTVGVAARLRDIGGPATLSDCGVDAQTLGECAERAAERPELSLTPPRAELAEIRELYASAN